MFDKENANFTYILLCADHTLYCGWTNHLDRRLRAHNKGKGAKYTKGRRPVRLVYWEEFASKQEAMRREAAIKRLSRKEKEELIRKAAQADQYLNLEDKAAQTDKGQELGSEADRGDYSSGIRPQSSTS